jgi:hypothetical protein
MFGADFPSSAVQPRNDTVVGAHFGRAGQGFKRTRVGLVDWSGGRRWVRAGVRDCSPSSHEAEVKAARDFISPEGASVPDLLISPGRRLDRNWFLNNDESKSHLHHFLFADSVRFRGQKSLLMLKFALGYESTGFQRGDMALGAGSKGRRDASSAPPRNRFVSGPCPPWRWVLVMLLERVSHR